MKYLVDPQAPSIGRLPAALLRDNCPCADCRDPVSGQRLISIADLAPQLSVTATAHKAGGVFITFGPDGHQAVFSREWLASLTAPAIPGRSEAARQLWCAADFPVGPPSVTWADYETSDAARLNCLRGLLATRLHAAERRAAARGRCAHRRQQLRLCQGDQLRQVVRRESRARRR